jgi:hypothetical protein
VKFLGPFLFLVSILVCPSSAQTGFPFTDESLRYTINYPSGLGLGDAVFTAKHSAAGWTFTAAVDASFPGFVLKDQYTSAATNDLCTTQLDRAVVHGSKKFREKTTFDLQRFKAQRGDGPEIDVPACARDAVTLLYYARREMGQGRVPSAQNAYLGAAYAVRMEYKGEEKIKSGDKPTVTDRLLVAGKGPASSFSFEVLFARDAARTPLVVRIPLSMGSFSMELAR